MNIETFFEYFPEWYKDEGVKGQFDGLNKYMIGEVAMKNIDGVKQCIKMGADVTFKQSAALTMAVEAGDLNIIKLLVEKGCDIHTCGDQALNESVKNYKTEIVEYLSEKLIEQAEDQEERNYYIKKLSDYLSNELATRKYANLR